MPQQMITKQEQRKQVLIQYKTIKGVKSKLFILKDRAIVQDIRNCLCLLQVKPFQFSIELNIDSANFRFLISTRCTVSKKKEPGLSEPFGTVQQLSQLIHIKNHLEHFAFKILLTSLISTRLIEQLASQGSIPSVAKFIEIQSGWNVCRISIIASTMSSGESWNNLFVSHKITTFLMINMTGRFCARHKAF